MLYRWTTQVIFVGRVIIEIEILHMCFSVLTNRTLAIKYNLRVSFATTTTVLQPFVRDYPGEPVPEETLTHPPS